MNLLILRDGIDPKLLDIDIAGHRLEEHLRINATPCFFLAQPDDPPSAQQTIVCVRADAWFTADAFGALATRLSSGDATPALVVKAIDGCALAACLAPEAAGRFFADFKSVHSVETFIDLVDRLPGCLALEAADLDCECPPQRVATLLDAARIEKRISFARARSALLAGVRIRDPDRICIRGELVCGNNVEIEVDVIIEGRVVLGDDVTIGAGCILSHSTIGNNCRINPYSIVDHAIIGEDSFVGPYGRIRPGSTIGNRVQIGNFVEIKQSLVGAGSRINHLAFIGDATLGVDVTIGAGVITCNHDGHGVNRTQIGPGAYVGSGTELVAPLSVGENAVIGAGSTITSDAPGGKLTLARSRQITVENWSQRKKKQ